MNKKIMLLGAVAVAGYFTLTAFGGKTKAEQMTEISDKVKMGLDEFRNAEKAKCDARVAEAVTAKYNEMMAAVPVPAEPAVAAKGGKKAASKGKTGGPKVDPLPQPTTPSKTPPTDDEKAKGRMSGQSGKLEEEKAKGRMSGEAPKQEEAKAKGRMQQKPAGGGN
jgi:hypothetical protein